MQFHIATDFNRVGIGVLPPGKFVAVGIAPASEVDICRVGALTLSPCSLVPFNTNIKPMRGFRTGIDSLTTDPYVSNNDMLVLVLYEACDFVVPPGPRAPVLREAIIRISDGYATAPRLALRLPFAGRTQAVVAVRRENGSVTGVTATVRGVRYLTPAQYNAKILVANPPNDDQEPFFAEQVETIVYTTSTVDQVGGPNTNQTVGGVFYIGGNGDNQEAFDELEVWIFGVEDGDVLIQAEASGERGIA